MALQLDKEEKGLELISNSLSSSSPTATAPPATVVVLSDSGKRMDQAASAAASPTANPALVLSTSGQQMDQAVSSSASLTAAPALVLSNSGKRIDQASSAAASPTAAPALVLSNSGKRMDPSGKKKYVKQVTGRHNDTELHLAAQRGDLAAVRQILREIGAQITGTAGEAEFDAEVAEIRAAVVNEVNEVGETALYIAAEKGFLDIAVELLKYSNRESLSRKNRSGFDALHVAAREGNRG